MRPEDNPYTPNAGAPPPELAGRQDVMLRAKNTIERTKNGKAPRSFIVLGLRGVGKTVLLNEFEKIAEKAGCQTEILEANPDQSLAALLTPHLHRLLLKLDRLKRVGHGLQQAFGLLWSFATNFKVKVGEIEVGIEKPKVTGDLAIDLSDLLVEIGTAAAARETAAVLLIDEIQGVSKADLTALIMALHKVAQRKLPLLLLGAGLPQLPKLAGDAKSYAERLFDFPKIDRLDPKSAERALTAPAEDEGVKYDADAVAYILKEASGYPFYIQVWGSHAWDVAAGSPITLANAKEATRLALKTLDEGILNTRFQRLTERQQMYARAMAEGPLPANSTRVATALGIGVKEAAPLRDEVIKKGIAYSPARGLIDFTIPLFDAYLKRQIPQIKKRSSKPHPRRKPSNR